MQTLDYLGPTTFKKILSGQAQSGTAQHGLKAWTGIAQITVLKAQKHFILKLFSSRLEKYDRTQQNLRQMSLTGPSLRFYSHVK